MKGRSAGPRRRAPRSDPANVFMTPEEAAAAAKYKRTTVSDEALKQVRALLWGAVAPPSVRAHP